MVGTLEAWRSGLSRRSQKSQGPAPSESPCPRGFKSHRFRHFTKQGNHTLEAAGTLGFVPAAFYCFVNDLRALLWNHLLGSCCAYFSTQCVCVSFLLSLGLAFFVTPEAATKIISVSMLVSRKRKGFDAMLVPGTN